MADFEVVVGSFCVVQFISPPDEAEAFAVDVSLCVCVCVCVRACVHVCVRVCVHMYVYTVRTCDDPVYTQVCIFLGASDVCI